MPTRHVRINMNLLVRIPNDGTDAKPVVQSNAVRIVCRQEDCTDVRLATGKLQSSALAAKIRVGRNEHCKGCTRCAAGPGSSAIIAEDSKHVCDWKADGTRSSVG